MGGDVLGHLEHCDLALAAEDCLESGIRIDVAPVLRVLETVFLDVVPDFFSEFATGKRSGSYDCGQNIIRLHGFEKGGIGFALGL